MKRTIKIFLTLVIPVLLLAAAALAVSAEGTPACDIGGHNLSMEESLKIIYYVHFENVPDGAETGLLIFDSPLETKDSYVLGAERCRICEYDKSATETNNGVTYNRLVFDDIKAKEMSKDFYARAYIKKDSTVYYGETEKYSVLQYAHNILKNHPEVKKTEQGSTIGTLIPKILEYGAAVQDFIHDDASNLGKPADGTYYQIKLSLGHLSDGFNIGLYAPGESVTISCDKDGFVWYNEKNGSHSSGKDDTITMPSEDVKYFAADGALVFTLIDEGENAGTYKVKANGTLSAPVLIIPSHIGGKEVTEIEDNAFKDHDEIVWTVIPNTIRRIGASAFENCTGLIGVIIPEKVKELGDRAFKGCTSLIFAAINSKADQNKDYSSDVTLGDLFDSLLTDGPIQNIGSFVFDGCSSLTHLFAGRGVRKISEGAFRGCESLTKITYKGTIAEWLRILKEAGWNTGSGITGADCDNGAVPANDSVTFEYSLNGAETEYTVTSVTVSADGPRDVEIPAEYNGKPVAAVDDSAAEGNNLIGSLTLPDTLRRIDRNAFSNCGNLQKVTINSAAVSIGSEAFKSDYSLALIEYCSTRNDYFTLVTKGGEWDLRDDPMQRKTSYVVKCTNGTVEEPHDGYSLAYDIIDGDLHIIKCYVTAESGNISVVIPAKYEDENVTAIEEAAFEDIGNLQSVSLPETITEIGPRAFEDCTGLETITFAGWSSFWRDDVTKGSYWDTRTGNCVLICQDGFFDRDGKVEYTFSDDFTGEGYVLVSAAAADEYYGTVLYVPSSYSGLPVTEIGEGACRTLENISAVNIPKSVKTIGRRAFEDLENLENIVYAGTKAEWLAVSKQPYWKAGATAFTTVNCSDGNIGSEERYLLGFTPAQSGECELSSVITDNDARLWSLDITIPETNGERDVTRIGDRVFQDNCSVSSVRVPLSVTAIGESAFDGCAMLSDIYYAGTCMQWKNIIKGTNWNRSTGTYTIHCSDGNIDKDINYTLTYTPISEGEAYAVSFGSAAAGETAGVVIPAEYGGKPVTELASDAFRNCTQLRTITIPVSITVFGEYCFSGCENLTDIVYEGTVAQWQSINKTTHWNSTGGSFTVNCSDGVFRKESTSALTYTLLEGGEAYALSGITPIRGDEAEVIIGSEFSGKPVTAIASGALAGRTKITSVYIPESITSVSSEAFTGSSNITWITYGGTAAQWNAAAETGWDASFVNPYSVTCSDRLIAYPGHRQ